MMLPPRERNSSVIILDVIFKIGNEIFSLNRVRISIGLEAVEIKQKQLPARSHTKEQLQ